MSRRLQISFRNLAVCTCLLDVNLCVRNTKKLIEITTCKQASVTHKRTHSDHPQAANSDAFWVWAKWTIKLHKTLEVKGQSGAPRWSFFFLLNLGKFILTPLLIYHQWWQSWESTTSGDTLVQIPVETEQKEKAIWLLLDLRNWLHKKPEDLLCSRDTWGPRSSTYQELMGGSFTTTH